MPGRIHLPPSLLTDPDWKEGPAEELNRELDRFVQTINVNADLEELRWFYPVPTAGLFGMLVTHYPRRIRAVRAASIANTCSIRVGWGTGGATPTWNYVGWQNGAGAGNAYEAVSVTPLSDLSSSNFEVPEGNVLALEISSIGGGAPALSGLAVTLLAG